MHYRIIKGVAEELEREVQKALDEGWTLHGPTIDTGIMDAEYPVQYNDPEGGEPFAYTMVPIVKGHILAQAVVREG